MSGIINALFGGHHKDEKKQTSPVVAAATTTTNSASSASGSSVAHTAISDDVRVKSVVSTESNSNVTMKNSSQIADLLNKLGSTHNQIDEYSKKRNAQISDAVGGAIDRVVAETAAEQQQLLADANQRSAAIEFEHKQRLQERVAQLDNEKAILLAELERQLNDRQEAILLRARENIDGIQNAANAKKMAVLLEAQSQSQQQVGQITEQVAGLAAEDAQRRLQTTTQTVITSSAVASSASHQTESPSIHRS